jgi:sialate O-acetylesterase
LLYIFLTLLLFSSNSESDNPFEIPAIFSDNMVLQQNTTVKFWGRAEADVNVTINTSWGKTSSASVNTDGDWVAEIQTPNAGGPYDVNLQFDDTTVTYKNVMIGEVWLCSGQSNMEMPLKGWPPNDPILNSEEEIANADFPDIRMFTLQRNISYKEEFNCSGTWEECNPINAGNFSATAYFFGRKLYRELKVPIGLIHSSWGGTPVEAWTNGKYLENVPEFNSILDDVKNSASDAIKYESWLEEHPSITIENNLSDTKWENLDFDDANCCDVGFNDAHWNEMELPQLWEESELGNFDGVVWFRKIIELPDEWLNKDLIIELGPIDDMDRTYVNGKLVGAFERDGYWQTDRIYKIHKDLVTTNEVVIAVRVADTQGGGGIWGDEQKLIIQPTDSDDKISLAGKWKYLPVAEYRNLKFFIFGSDENDFFSRPKMKIDFSQDTPTTLYNGMINPLIPYSIKGVIWYQGEDNVRRPEQYAALFPLMIENWRIDWGVGNLPFYFVQIAPFDYGDETHSERLRESQLKTLSVHNTGMVVTLDIGNPDNIHPAYKKDVGERLALWALAKTYNKSNFYSGPLYKSSEIKDDYIIISFNYADNGWVLNEINGENYFLIAGNDRVFNKASVKIDGNNLIVFSDNVTNPVAVRYAWSNTAEATLFNAEGLPASSFRTDDWDE